MAHVSFLFQYNGTKDTKLQPKIVLLGYLLLFDNMLVYPFVCFLCFFAGFVISCTRLERGRNFQNAS